MKIPLITKAEWERRAVVIREQLEKDVEEAENAAGIKWTTNYRKMEEDLKTKLRKLNDQFYKSSHVESPRLRKEIEKAEAKLKEVRAGKAEADSAWTARYEAAKAVYAKYREEHPELQVYEEAILKAAEEGEEIPDEILVGSKLEGGLANMLLTFAEIKDLKERHSAGEVWNVEDSNKHHWHNSVARALRKPELLLLRKDIKNWKTSVFEITVSEIVRHSPCWKEFSKLLNVLGIPESRTADAPVVFAEEGDEDLVKGAAVPTPEMLEFLKDVISKTVTEHEIIMAAKADYLAVGNIEWLEENKLITEEQAQKALQIIWAEK